MADKILTICCVTDGKPGHKSQLEGLLQALSRLLEVRVKWIGPEGSLFERVGRCPNRPDLILAAGHKTHLAAVLMKWSAGSPLVVLMKPSLPLFLFDICVIPEHDRPPPFSSVIASKGVLNAVMPSAALKDDKGLILVGGPSKHHGWDNGEIVQQLTALKQRHPAIQWTLTTSRRTPEDFVAAIADLADDHFVITPFEQTDKAWLQQQWQQSRTVWVTEDSVSMVYESLATGAQVGLLTVPRIKASRVSAGVDQLLADGWVGSYADLQQGRALPEGGRLQEADRVAKLVLTHIEAIGS